MPEKDDKKQKELEALHRNVFQNNPDGEKMLTLLADEHVFVQIFSTDPLEMAARAARHDLVVSLMIKSGG